MEIIIKIGDARYPDNPVYLKNWLNGQPVEARWDGFNWGHMDRRHFAIIRTTDDFWTARGGKDWKVWNAQAREFKKFFSVTDSQGKYRWEFGFLQNEGRVRDWFLDYDELVLQKLITQGVYDTWKDHDTESPIINIDRSFFDIIKNEYESRVFPTELKNQGITSGTYQIGTGAGADYATIAAFVTDVNAGGTMTDALTGEHQSEETALTVDVAIDVNTNTHLLKITAESGAEHNGGAYGNGARINYSTWNEFKVAETTADHLGNVEISKLAFDIAGSNNIGFQIWAANSATITVNRCLMKGDADSRAGIFGQLADGYTFYVINNIVYGCGDGAGDGGIIVTSGWAGKASNYVYNNTCIGNYDNFVQEAASGNQPMVTKNNLAQADSGGSDYRDNGRGWETHSKNISEDASGPDVAYRSKDVHTNSVFKNYAADDYRLDSGGDATNLAIVDDGDDLSGTFTDDIEGQTRSTWYIGASEIVAAGGEEHVKNLSDTINLSDAHIFLSGLNRSDLMSLSDSQIKNIGRPTTDTISISDGIAKNIGWSESDSITMSDGITKAPGLPKADTITLSDNTSMVASFLRSLNDTINMSDGVVKNFGVTKSDTITLSDNLVSIIITLILNLNDTINLSDDIVKNVGAARADTINISDNFSKVIAYLRSFADTITLSDLGLREAGLNKADTVTLSDSMTKEPRLSKTDIIALSDSIAKELGLNKTDTITLSDFFSSDAEIILAIGKIIATITGRGPGTTITGRGPGTTITGRGPGTTITGK